jgi:tRNA threonylcarbamoyladenosine biosynthesis protein TsaE
MITVLHADHDNEPGIALHLQDEAATLQLGALFGAALSPGLHLWLEGDLGSGKTTFTRGLLHALGHTGKVKSPTYTLIEPYVVSRLDLYHFDFYRLNSPDEYLDAGLDEYFSGSGVCVVEWPEKALPHLAAPDVVLRLRIDGEGRHALIAARTEKGQACVTTLASALQARQT